MASHVRSHALLFVVAGCCSAACSAEVVFEDGSGAGGSTADTNGSSGDAGTGGGYDGFTCIGMCAELAAKASFCVEDTCLSSCRPFIRDAEAAGCLPELLACFDRAVEVDVCVANCVSDAAVSNCFANQ